MSKEAEKQIQTEQIDQLEGYKIQKTLGEGNFGKVKLGIHKITGQQVAIKILEKDLIYQKTDIQRISRQIKIMKQVRHPNIIQLYQIIQTTKRLYLIMEYAENGDLFDQIVKRDQLPQQQAQEYFAQLILGLQYLHSLGITHRDLKPQNLLLSGSIIKIADFGLGNFFNPGQLLKTACGSPCYAPPQMLNKVAYDPKQVDLWSSGIILHAMVLGYLPFQDQHTLKLYQKIKTMDFKLPFRLSLPCKNLINSLLKKDPLQRITIQGVKQHQWLKNSYQTYKKLNKDIDENLFKQVCQKYGIVESDRLMNNIKKNKHNNLTTLYYLGEKVITKEKINNNNHQFRQNITFQNLIEQSQDDQKNNKKIDNNNQPNNEQNLQNFDKINNNNINLNYPLNIKLESNKQEKSDDIIAQIQSKQKYQTNQKQNQQKQKNIQHQKSQHSSSYIHIEQVSQKDIFKQIQNSIENQDFIQKPRSTIQDAQQNDIINNLQKQDQSNKIDEKIEQAHKKVEQIKEDKKYKNNNKKDMIKIKDNNNKIKDNKNPNIQKQQMRKEQIKKQKRLVKKQRMPIHKPTSNSNNKPLPPLYQHSQSKQKPLILKKILTKLIHTSPHLFDQRRIILCTIQQFIHQLQKKGCHGKIQYYQHQKQYIYLLKYSIHGRSIQSTIKQINQKYK